MGSCTEHAWTDQSPKPMDILFPVKAKKHDMEQLQAARSQIGPSIS